MGPGSGPGFSSIGTALTPAPFKVRSEQKQGVFVVQVEGELDMNTAGELERQLEAPLSAPDSNLLIDLSRCEFIDSTGIALIVRAWQALDDRFSLCGIGDQVKRVLDVTGLESTIPNHPSRDDALARLRS
jgi:anti-anti-sigma factor